MELLQRDNPRTTRLIEYFKLLIDKQAGKGEFHAYESDLQSTTPFEVNEALDYVLRQCEDVESLALPVAQFIRAVSKSLEAYPKTTYPKEHLLYSLQAENRELQDFSLKMQQLSLKIQQEEKRRVSIHTEGTAERSYKERPIQTDSFTSLVRLVASTDLLASHYVRLQNELFPLFEEAQAHYSCVKLMWTLQDKALSLRKEVLSEHSSLEVFWKVFGQFYYHVQILLYREEHILFPVAYSSIAEKGAITKGAQSHKQVKGLPALFVSSTGALDFPVLEQIFKLLPLDIAFIGSDDRLKFYSDPPHRIFPRSPQLIGRLVQNCHPPKSVATVEKILVSFKEGDQDSAEFYLTVGGKFIHIEYFAVRSEDDSYLGTLEVSQDATHLRELAGEKRLL